MRTKSQLLYANKIPETTKEKVIILLILKLFILGVKTGMNNAQSIPKMKLGS